MQTAVACGLKANFDRLLVILPADWRSGPVLNNALSGVDQAVSLQAVLIYPNLPLIDPNYTSNPPCLVIDGPVLTGCLRLQLWDIKGKMANMPVHDLLGGKTRKALPVYVHADGNLPTDVRLPTSKLPLIMVCVFSDRLFLIAGRRAVSSSSAAKRSLLVLLFEASL